MADSGDSGFWASTCGRRARFGLAALLVACFAAQTALVYLDPAGFPPLTPQAEAGRRTWHRSNCQSCHQLYGMGGFLGPDLTNATSRLGRQRFEQVLTSGTRQMPAFDLGADEIAAVIEFLAAMDRTGGGQVKVALRESRRDDSSQRMIRAIQDELAESGTADATAGFGLFMLRECRGCHLPLGGGPRIAPDLLSAHERLGRAAILDVLEHGRPPAMPAPVLSAHDREVMAELLAWLSARRSALARRSRPPALDEDRLLATVPWWEYE